MLVVFIRALILFLVLFLVIRLMGKSELSQIQPFEFVIIVVIADLATGPMSDRNMTMLYGIIPILALLFMYMILNLLLKTNKKIQTMVSGSPVLLIANGKVIEKEMRKQSYVIEDIMSQIRSKGIFKIQDVAYAILETDGQLSVIDKKEITGSIPLNIISDGERLEGNLEILNVTDEDLNKILKSKNIKEENVLVATLDENKKFLYQKKGGGN
ncbi:MAG: DUF421 domain-containing protein [Clostridia bacterium]|nr:DUF421 domain-containing protein [Clostridia bacterium]MDD4376154.1 DUF421 domain-containing protein [Clostridia bacterium]